MKPFSLTEYLPLLAQARGAGLEVVLVGGQAVSLYAAHFVPDCPAIAAFAPFVSKDADLLGTVDDGLSLARRLNVPWQQSSSKGGMRGLCLGHLSLPHPADAKVEILGYVLGADAPTIRATAYQVEVPGGEPVRVINPFLLYRVKGINVVRLAQREPGRERQDTRQFAVMGLVVNTVLQRFCRDRSPESIRPLVKTCGQLLDFWLSSDGAALVAGGAADPAKVLPLAALREHPEESVRNLVGKRWPVFSERQLAPAVSQVPPGTIDKVHADFQEAARLLGTVHG